MTKIEVDDVSRGYPQGMTLDQLDDIACPDVAWLEDRQVEPGAPTRHVLRQDVVAAKPRIELEARLARDCDHDGGGSDPVLVAQMDSLVQPSPCCEILAEAAMGQRR